MPEQVWAGKCLALFFLYRQASEETVAKRRLLPGRKQRCRFCTPQGCPRPIFVDFKDTTGLKRLMTSQAKILPRKRTYLCAAYQRAISRAIKRARYMALLPYVGE
jgi:small subunit ribosomal protein S18